MDHFDFVVLGGGSGGVASARRAASHGARVALVEAGRLGGTCVNVGCVPKKITWTAASLAEAIHDAPGYGFEVGAVHFDWARMKRGRDEYVRYLNGVYRRNLEAERVTVVEGYGRFVDAHTLEVEGRRISGEHVLVATGGRPSVLGVPGADLAITSDGFFDLDELPRRVAIVGGGYIAVELAGIFRALGSEVTVVVRKEEVLQGFDETVRVDLMEHMAESGVRFVRPKEVVGLERHPRLGLRLFLGDGAREEGFDCAVWAVGRDANTRGFGLEALGVALAPKGHVVVDEFQNTSVAGIYAVGDVTGRALLTPVAIASGRRLADRLFGGQRDARLDYENIPTVVFSHPPIGTVGLTEEQARETYGDDVEIYLRRFVDLHYSLTPRKPKTTVKLVTVGRDERIVGIHVIGLAADEMIQGFAVALRMGARKSDLDRTVAIHPTAAEELVTLR